jgi:hypothetical protein
MKIPNDTTTFKYFNVNPKNKHTTDCVARAICAALDQSYEQTVRELTELWLKTGYEMGEAKCYGKYLESKGWIKYKQPRKPDNTKFTGKEFCKGLNKDVLAVGRKIVANIGGGHIVCIMETEGMHGTFKVHDIWDSTDGCIGNYWTKGE